MYQEHVRMKCQISLLIYLFLSAILMQVLSGPSIPMAHICLWTSLSKTTGLDSTLKWRWSQGYILAMGQLINTQITVAKF